MNQKLRLWQEHPTWEDAEKEWDSGAAEAAAVSPIKSLKTLPDMPGITPETAKGLKWKSLKWIIAKDTDRKILKGILKHPFRYGWRWLKSILKPVPYAREGDFFLYGVKNIDEFSSMVQDPDSLLVIGFSYCHKPFECPSGRFTEHCIHDPSNAVCRQCFIGKAVNAVPEKLAITLFIPTIHYVGGEIFDIIHRHPNKRVLFIITACEMTLRMFGDLGNMVDIRGIGIRLDGRICNTMKAFELSEEGIKPGLTVVLPETQKVILKLLRQRLESI